MLAAILSPLGLKMIAGALFAIALASVYGVWHHSVFTAGKAEQLKTDQPKIDGLDAALKTAEIVNAQLSKAIKDLREGYAAQSAAVEDLKTREAKAQADAKAAIAAVVANTKYFSGEVSRLRDLAAKPNLTGDDCADVDSLLRGIAADRLRHG